MTILVETIPDVARGETNTICVDWGENTAGQETGVLKAGDTVASCTITVYSKPTGATDPTLGSVSVNATALHVNERSCSAGEATTCSITTASDQTAGVYTFKLTATTTNSKVIPRYVRVNVVVL
jgi:hypothetical protein